MNVLYLLFEDKIIGSFLNKGYETMRCLKEFHRKSAQKFLALLDVNFILICITSVFSFLFIELHSFVSCRNRIIWTYQT